MPGSERLFAVWNPAPAYETRPLQPIGGDRTPLVVALGSAPDGRWSRAVVIDGKDGVDEGYSYTAIHFTSDGVLLAYCAGGAADKHRLAKLRIKKLPLSDFK